VTVLELTSSVQVGRQGIYDWDRSVVAYEILFRPLPWGPGLATESDHERATSQVINAVFGDFGVRDLAGSRPLFINVTRSFLVGELPLPGSPDQVVVEVVPHVDADDEVVSGVRALRGQGFRVALDGWSGEGDRGPLVELSDIVKIDLGLVGPDALGQVIGSVRDANPDATLAVVRVEDAESFRAAHELGVELFQGYHLHRPQVVETPQLAPSEVMCLRLLGVLSSDDLSMRHVETLVAGDPGLAVRVLRTASSSAASGRPVSSLRQALALIGPRMLSSWVVLMLVGGTGRVAHDHVVTLLARAGACANLTPAAPHVAYTVGLLSGVSDILGMSPVDTIRTTGVGPDVADALICGEGSAGTALRAVLAHERGHPQAVVANGFAPFEVSRAYLDAVRSANAVAAGIDP
jgi:EAL and modified HD-GYP domain-containing signal transduction protein